MIALAAMPLAAQAAPGDISTVAGVGTAAYDGDGGLATSAHINSAFSVVPTPDGGFLIADNANNRIRKVLNGIITTVAGTGVAGFSGDGGPATAAKLNNPTVVAPTPDGGFLIADSLNARIRKVLNGTITTVAGTGALGSSGDGGPATSATLKGPTSVALTADGGFLIADSSNNRIRKVSADGTITTVAGSGTAGFSGDGGPATAAELSDPTGVAPTPDGGFLIADQFNNRIRKVLNGQITTVAGTGAVGYSGDNGPATSAKVFAPTNVSSTPDGGFLIADNANSRIRKVLNGQITTVAGVGTPGGFSGDGGAATAAKLNGPTTAAPAPDGGFLIADAGNHRIRRVEGVPTPTLLNTDPPSPATATTVKVFGTALSDATVSLFGQAGCGGAALATGSGGQLTNSGIPVTVAPDSTTTFYARASQNGYTSACSATFVTYTQHTPDTTAPQTTLGKAKIDSKHRKAAFRFSSTETGSTFSCKLDHQKKFSKCRSPKTYKHLTPGKHTFLVRATDAAGNVDKSPAKRVFRIAARR